MNRLYQKLLNMMNMTACLGIVCVTLLVAADVIGRIALNSPIVGVPEIVKAAIVCIVWLQMAFTLRSNGHLRSDLFFGALPNKAKRVIYGLNCIGGICVFGLIAWYTSDDVVNTFVSGTFEGEHPVRIPVWPIWAILVFSSALMALEYILQLGCVVLGRPLLALNEGQSRVATLPQKRNV